MSKLINRVEFRVLFLFLFYVCASTTTVVAQTSRQDRLEPQWIKKLPVASNSTFSYEITRGRGRSVTEAEKNCMSEIVAEAGLLDGVVVSYDNVTKTSTSQKLINGRLSEIVDARSKSTSNIKSSDVKLYIKGVDQHCEMLSDGTYMTTKLYAKSSTYATPLFDNVEVTPMYGANGLWRSAIVPGWGQFYKGSKLKGGLMLGGVAALSISAIFVNNQANDYTKKMKREVDLRLKRSYSTKADNYTSVRNVLIGGAAAIYIYNIVDAIVAPGARRVKINRYSIAPTLMNDGSVGISGGIRF